MLFRRAATDVSIGGVDVPKGGVLAVCFAAANRDDRQFECPEQLKLDRRNSRSHLAFGTGVHTCLGAPLAQRELHWSFTTFVRRLRNIRLLDELNDYRHYPSIMLRSLRRLHIAFEGR